MEADVGRGFELVVVAYDSMIYGFLKLCFVNHWLKLFHEMLCHEPRSQLYAITRNIHNHKFSWWYYFYFYFYFLFFGFFYRDGRFTQVLPCSFSDISKMLCLLVYCLEF